MANVNAPFGFRPVRHFNGAPYNGAAEYCYWVGDTSNTLHVGDPVKLSGTGDDEGVPAVARAAANGPVFGVVAGIGGDANEDLTRDTPRFLSTANGYVLVARGDDVLFEAQEDSDSATLAKTDIGRTVNAVFGTPSTSHPIRSAAEIDSSSAATTSASMNFQLVECVRAPDNAIGTNARWLVRVNNHDNGEV